MNRIRRLLMPLLAAAGFVFAGFALAAGNSRELTLSATERPVKVEFFPASGTARRASVLMLHGEQGWGGAEGRIDDFRHYSVRPRWMMPSQEPFPSWTRT